MVFSAVNIFVLDERGFFLKRLFEVHGLAHEIVDSEVMHSQCFETVECDLFQL
jgi:hypothetical protein